MTTTNGVALQLDHEEPIRVMAIHALKYCQRLFYLEEVEEIRVANEEVYAGRALHELVAPDEGRAMQIELTAEKLGLTGKIDCVCRRDGATIPYEYKRGRARRVDGKPVAWPGDALQVAAYGMMLEEVRGISVPEGRVRYCAENVTAIVKLDDALRQSVRDAIVEARRLRQTTERPPVTTSEKRCVRCSLAPICLPEEERLTQDPTRKTKRLFPANRRRSTVRVLTAGTQIGKSGEAFLLTLPDGTKRSFPTADVDAFVIEGFSQITTQALQLCAAHEVGVHWLNPSGSYLGSFSAGVGPVQRRIRQYEALRDEALRLRLTRRLVRSKIEQTLRYLLRCARDSSRVGKKKRSRTNEEIVAEPVDSKDVEKKEIAPEFRAPIMRIRNLLKSLDKTESVDALRGLEGAAARAYFETVPLLLKPNVPPEMVPNGRSRRPPKDRFNAALSYLYSMLYASVLQAELVVGLEPAFGFFHTPRSSTPPLTLDLMELFRLLLCDVPLIGSINRLQWDVDADFEIAGERVWLSRSGKLKAIEIYERRLQDSWKHPVVGYSLSYSRLIELEARLLEKEWSGEEGLFAQFRIR